VQKEFEDFTEESRQLEQELETTLIQNEKQLRDASQTIDSLREENQTLRVSINECVIIIDHIASTQICP
jgi:predicted RNase H-like nuclease (RuvC/YqgF family)